MLLMPLVLSTASSHFPSLFQNTFEGWQRYWRLLSNGIPQPPEVLEENESCIATWIRRRDAAFARLRHAITDHAIDTLIVIAGDQDEWYSAAHLPNILIYAGHDNIHGFHNSGDFDSTPPMRFWEAPERFSVEVVVDHQFAEHLARALVRQDFDISVSRKLNPQGRPERRAPHALTRPLPSILDDRKLPIVPLIIKTVERSPGVLTGKRCIELGRSIARICQNSSGRIGIYASGGMSHDPSGQRSGWVDEPLDRWVIEHLENNDLERLGSLFSFRSDTTESGTGELRTWLVAAGAMSEVGGVRRTLIDYFPARKATAGCGWFSWETGKARE
jgi:hypothetical protein